VDILGIGPMELLLILIVMLMVFGPDKLPQMGAKLGRTMRDMRKATRAISSEINATREALTAEAKPITDPLQEAADAVKSAGTLVSVAKNPGQAIKESVLKELNPPAPSAEPENTIAPPQAQGTVVTATPLPSPAAVEDAQAIAATAAAEPAAEPLGESTAPDLTGLEVAAPGPAEPPAAENAPLSDDDPPSTPPSATGERSAGEQ
jgi:TatA/E family protein of Tat protein translocase